METKNTKTFDILFIKFESILVFHNKLEKIELN